MNSKIYLLLLGSAIMMVACTKPPAEQTNQSSQSRYNEPHRLQFHFSPDSMWMNDPNGMVYLDGEYHLFYQHYPDSTVWGPMHWGHAISQDLVHWEHMPIALYPDSLGYIFSGSAVYDEKNTSGLGSGGNGPLVAIYTYHDPKGEKEGKIDFQTQGIAYSTDKGRTWTKYNGNPVIKNPGIRDFRDPKVMWFEDQQKWVLTLAAADRVQFYSSKNLIDWKFESDFGKDVGGHGGVWECPDLLPLTLEGQKYWVLLVSINPGGPNKGSATQYFVGNFDGNKFEMAPSVKAALQSKGINSVPVGKVFEDFEVSTYKNWTATGEAFADGPVPGGFPGQNQVSGFMGKGLVNSFKNGDATQGTLTSPSFTINSKFIHFLVGGGSNSETTNISLLIDGGVVRREAGDDSEGLKWKSFDVQEFKGKNAQMKINDQNSGGWGHINVDHIVFSDQPLPAQPLEAFWLDYGTDNYAGVTWSNVKDRQIFMGWMSNWLYANQVPTERWRSAMTIPRTLELTEVNGQMYVASKPVSELEKLRLESLNLPEKKITELNITRELSRQDSLFELELTLDKAADFTIILKNDLNEQIRIGYIENQNSFFIDRAKAGKSDFSKEFAQIHYAPRLSTDKEMKIRLFVDVASVELFADEGLTVITDIVFPNKPFTEASIQAEREIGLKGMYYPLKSIWK